MVYWLTRRNKDKQRHKERADILQMIESSYKCCEGTVQKPHKHPGVYRDKEKAQVATLSEISTRLASTEGPLSDANDCCWGEWGGWYWCAGATEDAEPDSPSTALFSNKHTLQDKFKRITDSNVFNYFSLDSLNISNARASGMYFPFCVVSKLKSWLHIPDLVCGWKKSIAPINYGSGDKITCFWISRGYCVCQSSTEAHSWSGMARQTWVASLKCQFQGVWLCLMKGGDISTHTNGLLMGDSSAVLNTSIRYAVIAEELLRFNHVIESAVTQKGMRVCTTGWEVKGKKLYVFHPHLTRLLD